MKQRSQLISSIKHYGILLITLGALSGCKVVTKPLIQHYKDPWHKKVTKAGFIEKTFDAGTVHINYAEGPDNGPPLVLLHAQMMDWFDYSRVLPELSRSFHVFDVDYPGHGKSTAPHQSMNADAIGESLAQLMETHIHEPAFVTGNSSGGLLTAWLAANKPHLVKAILLEDPPLFASEYPEVKNTIAYKSFTTCHQYIEAGSQEDFMIYWFKSSKEFIEHQAGKKALPRLLFAIDTYKKAHPGEPVELRFLPDMMKLVVRGLSQFDPHFGNAFYDGSWNKGFDHAEALQKIQCPALLLHANFQIRPDGLLDGAMNQAEADRAVSLIPNAQYQRIDASHVVHIDKPEAFIRILKVFFVQP